MITSRSLWRFVALALAVSAPTTALAAVRHDVYLVLASEAVGQSARSRAADKREAESLMSGARQALKRGDLKAAEALTVEAEKLNVPFGILHLGDTPRKLRADLKAAQRSGQQATPRRPSQSVAPELPRGSRNEPAPRGPAAPPEFPHAVLDPQAEQPLAMPDSEGLKPLLAPLGPLPSPDQELPEATQLPAPNQEQPQAAADPDARRQSDFHLLSARKALAVGDVRRAERSVDAARKLGVRYGLHDDTPDRVAGAIAKFQDISGASADGGNAAGTRQMADQFLEQAQQLIGWKEYDEAERLVRHVEEMNVKYSPFDVQPKSLLERITAARRQAATSTAAPEPPGDPRGNVAESIPADENPASPSGRFPVAQAVFEDQGDPTGNRQAAAEDNDPTVPAEELPPEPVEQPLAADQVPPQDVAGATSEAAHLYGQGEAALKAGNTEQALAHFRQAYALRDQLDPATAERLQDHLQLLSAPKSSGAKPLPLIDSATAEQAVAARQLSNDVTKKTMAADKLLPTDAKGALTMLKEARTAVEASTLDVESRGRLLQRVDRKIAAADKYIIEHRQQIESEAKNADILKEVERRQKSKLEIDDKLAQLVDDFNTLMEEERYAEAEVLARRARELAPENPLVKQLIWQSKFVSRNQRNQAIEDGKESEYYKQMTNVDESAIPFDDNEPIRFGDARKWQDLTKTRQEKQAEMQNRRNERELEIERRLKTAVSLKFRERPLTEVLEHLAKLAAVNLHLDPQGLEEEGVASDTPVTIDLTQDISLKSALNLILEPLHLSYVIKDEVLKITSEQLRDGEVRVKTYDVADLVIPIPNFGPNGRTGMPGAIAEAYNMTGTGVGLSPGSAFVASQNGTPATGVMDPSVLAQINQLMPGSSGGKMQSGMSQPSSYGPGGMGGGAQADFDSLIELITATVRPQTWDEVGGPGSISPFQNNLSLVISQTEDVHDEIRDLLEQLRRNQDLQVTIEVRFITLSDTFFERIGVDFDFNIVNTSAHNDPNPNVPPRVKNEVAGLNAPAPGAGFPNFTGDLSIPFRQESFDLAVPQFGTPVPVANFGFAILSDLEAFLLVQAAQGDRRSNVLQAPKVTLFNGQLASVFDQTQQPFVISVIPVVGDFAAAYQPVITVLSEGQALTVQAVISHDRRFVRLTVLPLFSQIGDVSEFTFSGTSTTTRDTTDSQTPNPFGDATSSSDDETTTTDGVTVQLPNFSFVSVTTTVSVPDGGTVLLGGIKRLSEGRNEFGVPLLSKLPYIDRLFKNVGIGRETQSLMMMVTPRIIIQEEEEERLGIQLPP